MCGYTSFVSYMAVYSEIADILNSRPGIKAEVRDDGVSGWVVVNLGDKTVVVGDTTEKWVVAAPDSDIKRTTEYTDLHIPVENRNATKITKAFLAAL